MLMPKTTTFGNTWFGIALRLLMNTEYVWSTRHYTAPGNKTAAPKQPHRLSACRLIPVLAASLMMAKNFLPSINAFFSCTQQQRTREPLTTIAMHG